MAITWGSWHNTSSNGMRVGYTVSRTSVSSGSSSVKFTVRIYTQNKYPFSDNQHISYGSYLGSNTSFHNGSSGGTVHRATKTYTYSYSDYGTSRTLTSSATVGGVWSGLTPSVTIRLAVPARPYRKPNNPTNFHIYASNNSNAILRWNNRNTSAGPYTSKRIERQYWTGSSWSSWVYTATVSASSTQYQYTNLQGDQRYRFRIRANNKAGSSGWGYSSSNGWDAFTTPNAPSNVRAAVESTGDSIQVTWSRHNRVTSPAVYFEVQRRDSSGGSWVTKTTSLDGDATSWVDTAPNSGYNRYRVRAGVSSNLNDTESGWAYASAITTIVPPDEPTNLRVSPSVPDFNNETTVSWQHNHGGDGAAQTDYEFQYSVDGETWTDLTLDGSSSHLEEYPLPGGTLDNGVEILLRVRTRGNTQEGFGPWSGTTLVTGWTTPTVTLEDEAPPAVVSNIPFPVEWIYNQDENRSQLEATVEIWTADENGDPVARVQRDRVTDDSTRLDISTVLEDGANYVIRVQATSSREQTSEWASRLISIDMLPPAHVELRPQYDDETGVMVLEVEPREPRHGVEDGRNYLPDPYFTRHTPRSYGSGDRVELTTERAYVGENSIKSYSRNDGGTRLGLNWNITSPEGYTAASAWVYVPSTNEGVIDGYNFQWSSYGSSNITKTTIEPDTWTFISFVHYMSEGNEGSFWIGLTGTGLAEGDCAYFDAVVMTVADTEAAALEHVEAHFSGDSEPTETHAFRWAGVPHNSPSIKYELIPATADEDSTPFEATVETFAVQRSIDGSGWVTIIDDVSALQDYDEGEGEAEARNIISLMDLLPTISGRNEYRLRTQSVAPSTAVTSPVTVAIGPSENDGWVFLNYGNDMGGVLRVGNQLSFSESLSQTGEDVHMQGRRRPLSLFGEHETRTLSVSGRLFHEEPAQAPSAGSPLDSPPSDWRQAQRDANTICVRTPSGHRIYGRMSDLSLDTESLNITSLSFSVTENDFREDESTGAGVEVSN